jgi:aminopeptidase N
MAANMTSTGSIFVAVSDFNFGAMENKGLNIFNTRYVLADPETASDADIDAVAAVVAHEYFHNWSGNRVTCRDWFQLSLKEGLTVFRDQGFSEDMGSAAVQRIDQVRTLRAAQFPEDAGPPRPSDPAGLLCRDRQLLHGDHLQQGRRSHPHDANDPWAGSLSQGYGPLF